MKFKLNFLKFILIKLVLFNSFFSISQDSESEIKVRAEKSFKNEDFVVASRLYLQLLAFNKTDPFYNYRYGVCLIYNSRKKQDAIKHLIYASKSPNFNPDVYFYLGKAYHLNFEFAEALKYYEIYKSKVGTKINTELDVNRHIEMSQNGKRLLLSVDEIIVLDKKEIETKRFFDIYDLKNIGGDIIVNTQFQSKLDKKKNHTPIIHFPEKPTTIYYSSYGEDETNGKDIFIRTKLSDGSWSLPQKISGGVNSKFDEDFPYMHPNGNFLYFSSKGHNSMGGYDVFRSKLNKETNTFENPENLDFAISSPDDDLFYIVDSLDKNAYFASKRQSLDGKIHVYKLKVEKVPMQIAYVKSEFKSTINASNKNISIDVFDLANNNKIGTFHSSEEGNLILTFPKEGNYEYHMKVDGAKTIFKTIINIPNQSEFNPLKQKIIHEQGDSGESVRVLNLFEDVDDDSLVTIVEIARLRSELNPNSSQYDLNAMVDKSINNDVYAKIGFEKLRDIEVKENINQLALIRENQLNNLKEIQQKSINKLIQNVDEIKLLQNELKTNYKLLENPGNTEIKEILSVAGMIVNKLNQIENESKLLISFSDSLSEVIKKGETESKKARNLSNKISEAYDKNDLKLMSQEINDNLEQIIDLNQSKFFQINQSTIKKINEIQTELKKIKNSEKELFDMQIKSKNELINLDTKFNEVKSKDKPVIQKKIDDIKNDILYIENELKDIKVKNDNKKYELSILEEKLNFLLEIQNFPIPNSNLSLNKAQELFNTPEYSDLQALKNDIKKKIGENNSELTPLENKSSLITNQEDILIKEYTKDDSLIVNKIYSDYFKVIEKTKNDKDLSKEDKINFLKIEENKLQVLLAKEINLTADKLKLSSNDTKLKDSLKILRDFYKTFKMNISENSDITENKIDLDDKLALENQNKKLTGVEILNQIKPNHFQTLNLIENNRNLSVNQNLENSQKEDQELIMLLSIEKNKINEKLKIKANDENLLHELSQINQLLNETDKRIDKRTMSMASFNVSENKTKEDYEAINKKEKKDDFKFTENEILVKKEDGIDDSNKTVLKESFEDKLSEKSNENTEVNEIIKSLEKRTNDIISTTNISTKVKQEKIIFEENELQKIVDDKIKIIDEKISKNKFDTILINEKKKLENVKFFSETRVNENKQIIISEIKNEIDVIELTNQIDKNYSKDLIKNQENLKLSIEEKTNRAFKIEDKFQENLRKKISANENKINLKEDLKLIAENQILAEQIYESKNRVELMKNSNTAGIKNIVIDNNKTNNSSLVDLSNYNLNKEFEKLSSMENEIKTKIQNSTISKSEKVRLTKQLIKIQEEKILLLEKKSDKQLNVINQNKFKFKETSNQFEKNIYVKDSLSIVLINENLREISILKDKLSNLRKDIKKEQIIAKINALQLENNIKLQNVMYSTQLYADIVLIKEIDPKISVLNLESKQSLEKRKFSVTAEINELQQEIESSKKLLKFEKNKAKKIRLINNIENKEKQFKLLKKQLNDIDKELNNRKEEESQVVNSTQPSALIIDELDRSNFIHPQDYSEVKKLLEAEIFAKEKRKISFYQLENLKENYSNKLFDLDINPDTENNYNSENRIESLKNAIKEYNELKSKHEILLASYISKTSTLAEFSKLGKTNEPTRERDLNIQNKINSNGKNTIAIDKKFQPFEILEIPQVSSIKERVIVGAEMPMGLVYRVQVGAFRKALKSNLYSEFKPVTGELIKQGITRYITGYFNGVSSASQAKKLIRNLGYKDAFVVAYCDGKRISIAEARKLEASGKCIPNGIDDFPRYENLAIKTNSQNQKTNNDLKIKNTNTNTINSTQNKEEMSKKFLNEEDLINNSKNNISRNIKEASVKTVPVETKQGLFFTVQIGAYRIPATAKQLKFTDNLLSKLLPDGMIRYSTGIFSSISACKDTKNKVNSAGIKDAFIVAYYKGERINLSEAMRLLKENGESIIEKP
jgi:hypothetical protein